MSSEPLPFGPNQASGWEALGGAGPLALNVTTDGNGVVRRRPGIQNAAEAPTTAVDSNGVGGLYVTSGGAIYAVGAGATRTIYRVQNGSAAAVAADSQSPELAGSRRPVFAETEALLVIAGGTAMQKVRLVDGRSSRLGGTPPNASHVSFLTSRLLANDLTVDRSKVRFSDPDAGTSITGHETWQFGGSGTSGFFSAEARPDPVVALYDNSSEIFIWGQTNLEVYAPDVSRVFARAANRDFGCIAPYSVVRYDQDFFWLDHRKRFVRSNGRRIQDVSGAISPALDDLSAVSDCFGYRVSEGPADCLVWTFPTAGVTYALQVGGGWGQWQTQSGGLLSALDITAHAHDPVNDVNYVGQSTGVVGVLQDGVADDLGETITAYVETGFLDHGSNKRKECKWVTFTLERGTTTDTSEPVAFVQWADAPGQWCNPRPIGLGAGGKTQPEVKLESLGVYRRRAWRFIFSADVNMALVRAEEEYEFTEE